MYYIIPHHHIINKRVRLLARILIGKLGVDSPPNHVKHEQGPKLSQCVPYVDVLDGNLLVRLAQLRKIGNIPDHDVEPILLHDVLLGGRKESFKLHASALLAGSGKCLNQL